ncbi:centriole and centriolar satellite protein OFD1 [Octopus bimaculoides]|nr:centriole and centriolar satellite protein OFD1 [Octopus bimaculoides]|eukprot:XP_014784792.1 PREDICTED: oral-facial-digital syndrome 1 protein homolog [Octopus bimaculoides]
MGIQMLSNQELLRLLHINPHSDLYKILLSNTENDSKNGFLLELLSVITSVFQQVSNDVGIQTEFSTQYPTSSLDAKLNGVEKIYMDKKEEHYQKAISGVEEKLTSLQKKLEERYQTELQLELARMKDNDLAKLRLEEKEASRKELEKVRQELEKNYQLKMNALMEKERNFTERIRKEEEIQQKDTYQQRQALLEEVNKLRQKESELTKMMEMANREKTLDQERLKCQEEVLKQKLNEANRIEADYQQRIDNEVFKIKIDLQNKFLERSQNMDSREALIKVHELRNKEEKEKFQLMKEDNDRKHNRINELETAIQEARHKEITATKHNDFLNAKLRDMIDYSTIKEQNAVLKNELETEKLLHAETIRKKEELLARQEEMAKDIYKLNQEIMIAKQNSERCRFDVKQEKVVYEEFKEKLDSRLQEEMNKNKELFLKTTSQSQQIQDLNLKNSELQTNLMLAEKALHQEITRKAEKVYFRSDANSEIPCNKPVLLHGGYHEEPPSRKGIQSLVDCQSECICNSECSDAVQYHHTRQPGNNVFDETDFSEGNYLLTDDTSRVIRDTKYQSEMLEKDTKNLKHGFQHFRSQLCRYPNLDPISPPSVKVEKKKTDNSRNILKKKKVIHSCSDSNSDSDDVLTPDCQSLKTLSSTPRKKLYQSARRKDHRDVGIPLPGLDISNLSGEEGDRTKYIKSDDERGHEDEIIQTLDEPILQDLHISNDNLNSNSERKTDYGENGEIFKTRKLSHTSETMDRNYRSSDLDRIGYVLTKERTGERSMENPSYLTTGGPEASKETAEEKATPVAPAEPSYVLPVISLDDAWRSSRITKDDDTPLEVPETKAETAPVPQMPDSSHKIPEPENVTNSARAIEKEEVAEIISEKSNKDEDSNLIASEIMEESVIESLSQSIMTNSDEDPFKSW